MAKAKYNMFGQPVPINKQQQKQQLREHLELLEPRLKETGTLTCIDLTSINHQYANTCDGLFLTPSGNIINLRSKHFRVMELSEAEQPMRYSSKSTKGGRYNLTWSKDLSQSSGLWQCLLSTTPNTVTKREFDINSLLQMFETPASIKRSKQADLSLVPVALLDGRPTQAYLDRSAWSQTHNKYKGATS